MYNKVIQLYIYIIYSVYIYVYTYNMCVYVYVCMCRVSLVAQMIKNLPALKETQVQPLGWEDTLEKWMATLSNSLAWNSSMVKEPDGLQSMGSQNLHMSEGLSTCIHTHTHIFIPFHILFRYDLSQDIEYSFLCYTVGLSYLCILYLIVCAC